MKSSISASDNFELFFSMSGSWFWIATTLCLPWDDPIQPSPRLESMSLNSLHGLLHRNVTKDDGIGLVLWVSGPSFQIGVSCRPATSPTASLAENSVHWKRVSLPPSISRQSHALFLFQGSWRHWRGGQTCLPQSESSGPFVLQSRLSQHLKRGRSRSSDQVHFEILEHLQLEASERYRPSSIHPYEVLSRSALCSDSPWLGCQAQD